jgi:adenylate cyclase class 2
MASDGREIEIKLPAAGVTEARRLLRANGFRVITPRIFEQNTVYDTAASTLRRARRLLRVRQIGRTYKLTYKGPPQPGKHKNREEIETGLADGSAFAGILSRLGYSPSFRYDKFRTEFRKGRAKGVATLDETPIGIYLELEGEPAWIDRTARTLGYQEEDYITASYARLFLDWKERTGSFPQHMLFSGSVVRDQRARK